jgi:hypothetical protein
MMCAGVTAHGEKILMEGDLMSAGESGWPHIANLSLSKTRFARSGDANRRPWARQ